MVLEYQSQFGSIYNHMLDFPIERINRFFDNHIFEVYLQPTHDEDYSIRTNVKVKLTGVKGYISVGDKKPHIEYTIYILPTDETSDTWSNLYGDIYGRNTSINTSSQEYANLRWVMNRKLENFLQYFIIFSILKVFTEFLCCKLNIIDIFFIPLISLILKWSQK